MKKQFAEAAALMAENKSFILVGTSEQREQFLAPLFDMFPEYDVKEHSMSSVHNLNGVVYTTEKWVPMGLPVITLPRNEKTVTITGVTSTKRDGGSLDVKYTGELKQEPWTPKRGDFYTCTTGRRMTAIASGERSPLVANYVSFACCTPTGEDLKFGRPCDDLNHEVRPATEAEKQTLLDALSKEGKQWNAEKLCIEGLAPMFKDGDFVHYAETRTEYEAIAVYAGDGRVYAAYLPRKKTEEVCLDGWDVPEVKPDRLANIDEIALFNLEFAKIGKKWNPTTKTFDRWRAEEYGTYAFVDTRGDKCLSSEDATQLNNLRFEVGNYFHPDADLTEYIKKFKDVFK